MEIQYLDGAAANFPKQYCCQITAKNQKFNHRSLLHQIAVNHNTNQERL